MPQFAMLDAYSIRARLVPAMLVILPVMLAVLCWVPSVTIAPVMVALFSWFGMGVLLAELARDVGKRREGALWATWGGSPTIRRLRLREEGLNSATRNRWRDLVAALVPDTTLPSLADETVDVQKADDVYTLCIARLRELTRKSDEFPLVFQENVSYGFRRNLWAMKVPAIVCALAAMAIAVASVRFAGWKHIEMVVLTAGVSALMLTWLLLRINAAWVREAAERYAEQLLWSCERLVARTTIPPPPPRSAGRMGF